jgi:hypothetical protein
VTTIDKQTATNPTNSNAPLMPRQYSARRIEIGVTIAATSSAMAAAK